MVGLGLLQKLCRKIGFFRVQNNVDLTPVNQTKRLQLRILRWILCNVGKNCRCAELCIKNAGWLNFQIECNLQVSLCRRRWCLCFDIRGNRQAFWLRLHLLDRMIYRSGGRSRNPENLIVYLQPESFFHIHKHSARGFYLPYSTFDLIFYRCNFLCLFMKLIRVSTLLPGCIKLIGIFK